MPPSPDFSEQLPSGSPPDFGRGATFNETRMTAFSDAALAVPPMPKAAVTPPLPANEASREPGAPANQSNDQDAQISALFTAMGRASQLSQEEIALHLQTSVDVVEALEEGDLDSLPEWEELSVVVERYAAFMNIDERPILRRLREQLTEHYLTVMSRHKTANGLASPMPMSDVSLQAFATGIKEALPPLPDDSPPAAPAPHSSEFGAGFQHGQKSDETFNTSRAVRMDQPLPDFRSHAPKQLPLAVNQPAAAPLRDASGNADASNEEFKNRQFLAGHNRTAPHNGRARGVDGAHDRRPDALLRGQPPKSARRRAGEHGMPNNRGEIGAGGAIEPQHYEQPAVKPKMHKVRSGLPLPIKIAANVAFVLIMLAAFISWQPNRFWSGVDQLPKPIANSIYQIYEFVMPDPLAMTYRMNWVHVDDPRMRKADRLPVPTVKRLPAIDFSRIGIMPK